MEIVTNDMIIKNQFQDKYIAIQEVRKSIKILQMLKKHTNFDGLYAARNIFRQWEIAPGYYFEQLFSEDNSLLSRNEKILLKTTLVNFNKIKISDEIFQFESQESAQCAWAFLNQAVLFSIPADEKWKSDKFAGIVKVADVSEDAEISNISLMEHIEIHKEQLQIRKYEFNPKHSVLGGFGTEMDISDQEAQELLMKAIPTESACNHLIAKKNERYYSFRRHHGNCIHGYWDNTMPEKYRKMADKYFK